MIDGDHFTWTQIKFSSEEEEVECRKKVEWLLKKEIPIPSWVFGAWKNGKVFES